MTAHKSLNISAVPVEVISHIFSFLPYSDFKEARLVCNQWYEASQDINLLEKEAAVSLSEFNPVFQETLLNSQRDFLHLSIREDLLRWYDTDIPEHCTIWYNTNFWARFGPKLRSLAIHKCKLNRDQFLHVLSCCPRLRLLDIVACTNLFRSQELVPSEISVPKALELPKLVSLRIAALYNCEAELFDIITSSACNLKELSLDECLDPIRLACPHGLTCEHIQSFVDKKPHCMFDLHLGCIEGDDFQSFIKLVSKPNVRLRSLRVHYNYSVAKFYSDNVMDLITSQKCLEELELTCEVGDLVVGAICDELKNLKDLRLLYCSEVVRTAGFLYMLKKLTSLVMLECYEVTSEAIMCGLCREVNTSLQSLTLTCGNFLGQAVIVEWARTHPSLTYLDLSSCDGVTSSSVQAIFRHLVLLRALILSSCKNLDDSGLSGKISDMSTRLYSVGYSISRLTGILTRNSDDGLKTYLPSPFELLSELRELNLFDCGLDGSAFKEGLQIPFLRLVVLSSNDISSEAFKCFVQNNRTIESLDVGKCPQFTDDVLDAIGLNLLRLKRINLQGCSAVSKPGINLLKQRIQGLKAEVTFEP